MKKEIESFQAQAVERLKENLVDKAQMVNGVTVVKAALLPINPQSAKDLVFKVREAIPEHLVCVIGSRYQDKPLLSVMLSDDMVKEHGLNAGQIIREAAKLIQGGGGGQPHYAQAGGKNIDGLSAAVDKVIELASL
jgi:alanyl-tRNA synthetase